MRKSFAGSKCPMCGKGVLVRRYGAEPVVLETGEKGSVPPAPHDHCPRCGESLYDRDTVRRISRRWATRKKEPLRRAS